MDLINDGWGYTEYWDDREVTPWRHGCYGILFCDDYPDEKFLDIGIIDEKPTKWYIGHSRQNDVTNIHVSGSIYTSDQFTPQPFYNGRGCHVLKWKSRLFSDFCSWRETKKWFWDYRESIYPTLPSAYRQVFSKCYLSMQHGPWYFFIWVGYQKTYDENGVRKNPDPHWDYWTPVQIRYERNGKPSKSYDSRDYVNHKLSAHVVGYPESDDFTVTWPSDWDWINKYAPRPSGETKFISTDVNLVPPPRNGMSYDISFPDNKYHWDEAFAESLSQVDFTTSNGIAYCLDAKELGTQLKSDFTALRSLARGAPGKLKIAASLFLSFHYGYKLMASDTAEFAGALQEYSKNSNRRIHTMFGVDQPLPTRGGMTLVEAYANQNVYYDPYGQLASETHKLAEALDIVPDFSNVWDMIPFSFVVDWFTNVGDLAEGIDAFFTLSQQHRVLGTIRSTKERYRYHVASGAGSYEYTIFKRWCIQDWYPVPEFSFQFKNPMTNLVHWAEGGALVVATRP